MIKTFRSLVVLLLVLTMATVAFAQETLNVGDTVEGDEDDDVVTYEIELEENQTVEISVESDEFDTYLELYFDGDQVEYNDDADGTNSMLVYQAPEAGTYEILIRAFASDTPDGEYTLSVEEVEVTVMESVAIEYGEEVEIDVEDAIRGELTFDGQGGDVITILTNSDADLDTNITLLNEEGDEVFATSNYYSDATVIRYELPDDSTYSIVITQVDNEIMDDEITVELLQSEILNLNEGAQTVELDASYQTDYMVLEVEEDQIYIIEMFIDGDESSGVSINVLAEDEYYAATRANAAGVDEVAFTYEAQDDGQVVVTLEYFAVGGDEVEVTVNVSALDN